jgi:hypothetical protein
MLTRHLVTALVGIALVMNSAAHAAPGQQDAGSFLRQVVRDLAANRYAAAWRSLHPSQQAAITRAHYTDCERLTPIPAGRTVVRVLGVRSVRITVAGGPRHPLRAFAVRLRITITSADTGASDTVVTTAHAIPIPSGWSWILSRKRFAADRRSDCGFAQPPV